MTKQPTENPQQALREPADAQAEHAFWPTQPVAGFKKTCPPKDTALPPGLSFKTVDLNRDIDELHALLVNNYVEDSLSIFRLEYSKEFIAWQLQIPGSDPAWNLGLFEESGGRQVMVGFISAARMQVAINGDSPDTVTVNFLCLDKSRRRMGLAPSLITEVTRRVNAKGIFKALFTAGEHLPFKHMQSTYFHRVINGKRLVKRSFCSAEDLAPLPPDAARRALRRMVASDVPQVYALYVQKYSKLGLFVDFTVEQLEYLLSPRDGIVECLVLEEGGRVAEFVSFFYVHSRVIENNPSFEGCSDYVYTAYLYYYNGQSSPARIIGDAIGHLEEKGLCDVLNCLAIEENTEERLRSLGFLRGDGTLYYYLFNWHPAPIADSQNGFIPF